MKLVALPALVFAAASPLFAQNVATSTDTNVAIGSGPLAVSGMASSARHCVFGDAANVHGIGWMATGTGYTITFDADFPLATAVARLDLVGEGGSTVATGNPDFRSTASTEGTMALHVGATGEGGCYRYKVELTPPAGATLAASQPQVIPLAPGKFSKSTAMPAAIVGVASSARHCVAGAYVANVHDIGYVEQGSLITISFASDFDPVAGVTLQNLTTRRGTYLVDDDTGGNLEPELHFTASHSATLALYVGGYNGSAGCYRYKVEIR